MVKDAQIGVLRRKRMEGKSQEAAAGMSVLAQVRARSVSVAAAKAAYVAHAGRPV